MIEEIDYEIGSDNVFADLGLEDADDLLVGAKLGLAIRTILEEKKLKQKEISVLLDIDQAEVSKLMNGKYYLFSESRLRGFLNKLDRKIIMHVSPRNEGEVYQDVVFA